MKEQKVLFQHSLSYVRAKTLGTAFLTGVLLAVFFGISGFVSRNAMVFLAIMILFVILLGMQSGFVSTKAVIPE